MLEWRPGSNWGQVKNDHNQIGAQASFRTYVYCKCTAEIGHFVQKRYYRKLRLNCDTEMQDLLESC